MFKYIEDTFQNSLGIGIIAQCLSFIVLYDDTSRSRSKKVQGSLRWKLLFGGLGTAKTYFTKASNSAAKHHRQTKLCLCYQARKPVTPISGFNEL